jgi:uncharacterized membrane protein YbhN (UPF0104 family)
VRAQIFAFAAGEAAKTLPMGAYVQNYLLQRSTGIDFARSSAATTVMIIDEIVVAMVGVALLGVGAWSTWLRPAILAGALAVVVLARIHPAAPRLPRWIGQHRILDRVREEFARLREGAAALAQPRVLIATLLLGAVYVFLDGVGLYVVVRALGIGGISMWQAVAVRCFGLAFYIVLGSLEAAGVGAFLGMGVSKSAAVSIILVNRALGILVTIFLAALTMALLHAAWRPRGMAGDGRPDDWAPRPEQTPHGLHYEETRKAPS